MHFSSFFYNLKQGIKNIQRNKMFSFVSMATMAACIFLFSIFFSIIVNFRSIVKQAESGVAVTVFFDADLSDEEITLLGEKIKTRPEVSKIKYVTAEEAWAEYEKEYYGDAASTLGEGFKNDNPLADSANYEVYLSDVSKQTSLVEYVESLDGVRQVNKSDVVANTLSSFNLLLGYVSGAVIIILLGVAVFLISNTVTTGISVRKEEIAIMKLIGASDSFVRAPFIVEGVIIGLIGAAIPLVIFYFLYNKVIEYIVSRFSILNDILSFMSVGSVYSILVPVALVLGVGIGFFGSIFAVRRHLDV
ncbi:cell division protein FtsX [Acetitomaculum ruminis DSM 5522]|uniref:Cell division protein FtsX n=1 Tax=Acetitomaculum ruminis DSM 5522 TaxID=1120918 RepID=A0A1I0XBC5_9FIRM|nr:permease-like cell division protein FtsX [Acetitomaculum ruminis]SFA98352.1 cell division protein FtsX [Acetitomaculum ruminis DSM 5522]